MSEYYDLDALVERVTELQPLPNVARKVMEIADSKSFSANELAAILSSDQALTAKLLRLANSAYYGYSRRIATVRDAVVLLGYREVKSIAMAASIMDLFAARLRGPFNLDLFWGHSVAVAVVCEALAKETGLAVAEEAFTAGVMHDIGKLVLNQYMPQEYAGVVQMALGQGMPVHQAEQRMLGFTHADVGGRLADRWKFPTTLVAAIGDHHAAGASADSAAITYIVVKANQLCHEHGIWAGFEYREPPTEGEPIAETDPMREALVRRLGGMNAVEERAKAFLGGTLQRPFAWYQRAWMASPAGESVISPGASAASA